MPVVRGVALEYTFMVQDGFGPLVESAAPTVEVAPGVVIPGERLERRPAQSGGRSYLVFRGGVGSYATFTHVDARGYNAGWAGAGGG